MNLFLSTLLSSFKAKALGFWTKLRMWLNPAFWKTKGIATLRVLFTRLLDVRPRHKRDYYSVFNWLVSKKLAFCGVAVVGILCAGYLYMTIPKNMLSFGNGGELRTYKYNAIPLKFYEGDVRILARDGHLAYVGTVAKAQCVGTGILYDKDGNKVYEGAFAESKFNGEGIMYYTQGMTKYTGGFAQNLFQGKGSYMRPNGSPEYIGEYNAGLRNGQGKLYNPSGNQIFSGTFLADKIVYSEFLGKPTTDTAIMYTGKSRVYNSGTESAVAMDEINAVYAAQDGSDTLEGGWSVGSILVLEDKLTVNGSEFKSINELTAYFGNPDYYGVSTMTLPEAVAANMLAQTNPTVWGTIPINSQSTIEGVNQVTDYSRETEIYIYTYMKDGLAYTFYTAGAGQQSFLMYNIELITQ